MSQKVLFSIIDTPLHPNFVDLYHSLGLENVQIPTMRKAIAQLKNQKPDYVVAEFLYGYGSNYASVNVSNLDVFLHSLQKYAPEAKVIVMLEIEEFKHIEKLENLFKLHVVLKYPISKDKMKEALSYVK
ncbi:MAG: hypothetical protein QM484_03995 [Woeseiaceae bacterium]